MVEPFKYEYIDVYRTIKEVMDFKTLKPIKILSPAERLAKEIEVYEGMKQYETNNKQQKLYQQG